MNDYTPTKTGARITLNEMLEALKADDSDRYWNAFETLSAMHNSLRGFRWSWADKPVIPVEHQASFDNSEYHRDDAGEELEIRTFSETTGVTTTFDDLRNHRCSMDHPPCPACELLEEREHEREAGL